MRVLERGWQAITVDSAARRARGPDGDTRHSSPVTYSQCRSLPAAPALVGASLGGFTSMLLAGELSPNKCSQWSSSTSRRNRSRGVTRIDDFMNDRRCRGSIAGGGRRRHRSTTRIGGDHPTSTASGKPAPPRRALVLALGSQFHRGTSALRPRRDQAIASTRRSKRRAKTSRRSSCEAK